ncbi:MAG: hypothetical protein J1E84_05860, partial [Muribaculaceae bacterium]|nr:hypothetical protein [Muribaculaceae bacterium]
YALDKVFPDWAPDKIAAQVEFEQGEAVSGNVYLVNGKIYSGTLPEGTDLMVRKANGRGGFGPAVKVNTSGITEIETENADKAVSTEYYNLQGQLIKNPANGLVIKVETFDNGKKVATKIVK